MPGKFAAQTHTGEVIYKQWSTSGRGGIHQTTLGGGGAGKTEIEQFAYVVFTGSAEPLRTVDSFAELPTNPSTEMLNRKAMEFIRSLLPRQEVEKRSLK
jgi:hypothetical protein